MRAVFFQIKNNKSKLQKIVETAYYHFSKNEKILFISADESSVQFVDDLLWKTPKTCFLPHFASSTYIDEKVVITAKRENLNNSKYIFNLCPNPLMLDDINIIYEFEDFTASGKLQLSRKKYELYKERKFFIESMLS